MAAKKQTKATLLTEKEEKELEALDKDYAQKPDVAVKRLLHEARDLESVATKDRAALIAGSELSAREFAELGRRAGLLERAEDQWDADRNRGASREVKQLREDAVAKRRAAFIALRYFLRQEPEVQARLDKIAEGSGDADLIDDCRRLSHLVDAHAPRLKKAKLGPKAGDALRAVADSLGTAVAGEAGGSARSLDLRNRAYWYLRAMMAEIRSGAQYTFRDEPTKAARYLSTRTMMRRRRPKKPDAPAPAQTA